MGRWSYVQRHRMRLPPPAWGSPPIMDEKRARDRERRRERGERGAPEDRPGEPGAEGGSQSPATDRLPAAPAGDDCDRRQVFEIEAEADVRDAAEGAAAFVRFKDEGRYE